MTKEELSAIIERHGHWLAEDCDKWEEMKADLSRANLRWADLSRANLRWADLKGADNMPYVPMACPDTGSFIGWKRCLGEKLSVKIVKLKISADAKRSSATGRKCRCDKAEVIGIEEIDGTLYDGVSVHSCYDNKFVYTIGKTVSVSNFCENRWEECAPGIHFFINRQEAVNYVS